MNGWITFWGIACLVGFAAFYLLVLAVIPLGALDLVKLFRHLSLGSDREQEGEEAGEPPPDAAPGPEPRE